MARKYYWPTLRRNVKTYIQGYNVCLASKAIRYKPYEDLQSLLVLTHFWKDLSMDFITGLPLSTNRKSNSYNSILVIVNRLIKIVYYELVKVTINVLELAKVIIDMVVQYYGLSDFIISDPGAIFTFKFCFSLCYFLGIKKQLSITFYP